MIGLQYFPIESEEIKKQVVPKDSQDVIMVTMDQFI